MPALYEVDSDTIPGRTYRVNLDKYRCECPGFTAHKHCKHVILSIAYANTAQKAATIGSALAKAERDHSEGRGELINWRHELDHLLELKEHYGHFVRPARTR